MPGPSTPILGLSVPTVGGDVNTWGGELNNDLAIIDSLGAIAVVATSINYAAVIGICPETLIRVTTGAGVVTVTLPSPAACTGRVWTIKKIDAGAGSITIAGCNVGVLIEGPSNDGNNANNFIGGNIQPASDGTALWITSGGQNATFNLDVHNAAIGVRFGANALRNALPLLRIEANTVDVEFDASSIYNTVLTSNPPVITDNSGSYLNWAQSSQDKPTNLMAHYSASASSGNLQANLQPYGNSAVAGMYRVCGYVEVSTAGSGGTYGVQIIYTDDAQAETLQLVAGGQSLSALGFSQGCGVIYTNGSVNVIWKVAVSGITGTPTYKTFATMERLSVP